MDINPLSQALFGIMEPNAAGAAEAMDGDAFAKMMAQLGLTPEAAPTAAVNPAVAERGVEPVVAGLVQAASAQLKGEAITTSADAEAPEAAPGSEPPLQPADLPPLLAALLAPVLQPAAQAVPATIAQQASAPAAGSASVLTAVSDPAFDAAPSQLGADGQGRAMASVLKALIAAPTEQGQSAPIQSLQAHFARPAMPVNVGQHGRPAAVAEAAALAGVELGPVAAAKPAAEALPLLAVSQAAPVEAAAATTSAEAPASPEPIIEQQLDLAHEGEWLDRLAKDIARTAGGEGNLRFRLNPEHLGSLHVELTQGSAGASVRLTADTEAARTILADAQPRLIAEARAQGVKIAEAHVDLGGQSQSQSGAGHRDGRDLPGREYLTTYKPESGEETPKPSRRSSSERYA